LANKIDEFYLAGGTALSIGYFQHRESYDLDFFIKDFNKEKISKIIDELKERLGLKIELIEEQLKDQMAKMLVYVIRFSDNTTMKIDFVEDFIELINPFKRLDGINILSIEDIYLREMNQP